MPPGICGQKLGDLFGQPAVRPEFQQNARCAVIQNFAPKRGFGANGEILHPHGSAAYRGNIIGIEKIQRPLVGTDPQKNCHPDAPPMIHQKARIQHDTREGRLARKTCGCDIHVATARTGAS